MHCCLRDGHWSGAIGCLYFDQIARSFALKDRNVRRIDHVYDLCPHFFCPFETHRMEGKNGETVVVVKMIRRLEVTSLTGTMQQQGYIPCQADIVFSSVESCKCHRSVLVYVPYLQGRNAGQALVEATQGCDREA